MTQESITQIPIDDLHESPFNPRKVFKNLDELAASIKAEGRIHEPLLVRPRIGPLIGDDVAAAAGLEIVFGHRRYRAARLAGLATVPCMVRAMSDSEARSAQTAENLQREDVHPIEEAEGFQSMIENDGLSADQLADMFGKSRSYIYGRLKLLQACPEVRQACLEDEIGSEVALLIARLRTDKLQANALASIRSKGYGGDLKDGGKHSFRRIRDHLVERYTLTLKDAIFEPEDAALVPAAGPCSACPKRSGNAPEFDDVVEHKTVHYGQPVGANVCTDPDCFAGKKAAHLRNIAAELERKGGTVISGGKARQLLDVNGKLKGGYVPAAEASKLLKAAGKTTGWLSGVTVTVVDQRTGKAVKAVKSLELECAGVEAAAPKKVQGTSRDWQAENERREAAAKAETTARRALHAQIRPLMLASQGSAFELRMIAWLLMERDLLTDDDEAVSRLHGLQAGPDLDAQLDQLTGEQLRAVVMDHVLEACCNVVPYDVEQRRAELHRLARHYGLDPEGTTPPSLASASTDDDDDSAGGDEDTVDTAKASNSARAAAKRPVKYRNPVTGDTWSGRGLKPNWLRAAISRGQTLADFDTTASASASTPTAARAHSEAGDGASVAAGDLAAQADGPSDESGSAELVRDPNTRDWVDEPNEVTA